MSGLRFSNDDGEIGDLATPVDEAGDQQQKKAAKKAPEAARKSASTAAHSGASGEEAEATDSLHNDDGGDFGLDRDRADLRATDNGLQRLMRAQQIPGTLAREMHLQDEGKDPSDIAGDFLEAYESLPNAGEGSQYLSEKLGADPPEYHLAIFPNENRLHVVTQLERYNNGKDKNNEYAGHIVACVGEVSPATGFPIVAVLASRENESELFELFSYNEGHLMNETEATGFALDEVNLGKFKVAPNLKGGRSKGANYLKNPLLLQVPGSVAQVFVDSPCLAIAYLRADSMVQGTFSEENDANAMEFLMQYIKNAMHSRDGNHSVLTSEWAEANATMTSWMQKKFKNRMQVEDANDGQKTSNKRKNSSPPPPRRSIPFNIFAKPSQQPTQPAQPPRPRGNQAQPRGSQRLAGSATSGAMNAEVMLEFMRENNKMLIQHMQGVQTMQTQALQSQGVGSTSTKLTAATKKMLQAAAGFEVETDFTLSEVYQQADGAEGKNDETFFNALVSVFAPPKGRSPQPRLHVTDTLSKDVRKGNLAHRNSLVVESLARGISPFAVLFKEYAQRDKEDQRRELYNTATHHSVDDVERRAVEFTLCLPNNYSSCKRALVNYEYLLEKTIGGRCPHLEWVKKIVTAWTDKEDALEPVVTSWHCVHLLWALHYDARQFFWECVSWAGGPVPESHLRWTWSNLMNVTIAPQIHCPYQEIMDKYGNAEVHEALTTPPLGARGGADRASTGTGTKPKRNAKIPDGVRDIVKKLRAKIPNISFAKLQQTQADGCNFRGLRLGRNNTCIDYALLGLCDNEECRWLHVVAKPNADKTATLVQNLENGLSALSRS